MIEPPSSPPTISSRARTTPTRAKPSDETAVTTSWSTPGELHQVESAVDSLSRTRRSVASSTSSTSYFSIVKGFSLSSFNLFAKNRKTTPRNPSRLTQTRDGLGDVIEIGPEDSKPPENSDEAERERLRDAAAQALGLGLGREEYKDPDPDLDEDEIRATASESTHPYIHPPHTYSYPDTSHTPHSLTSLPQPLSSPSSAASSPTSESIPPYPSPLSALTPYIQTRSTLLRYHPAGSFLALSLTRRVKKWRARHVILTAPLPQPLTLAHPDLSLSGHHRSSVNRAPQHAHLHLFKNASPNPDELEIDRLEINEDSVVFVAEHEIAGERDIVKVGGRDARGGGTTSASASIASTARSWHGGGRPSLEQNIEEMGRTMWFLKVTDSGEAQRWIGYIKTAVLVQRAERAGMTFQSNGGSTGVPSMHDDLDVLLSWRSQGLLPTITMSPRLDTYSGSSPSTNVVARAVTPQPSNPRFAEHVGAAPSRASLPPSFRAQAHPTSLKSLFSSEQTHTRPSTPRERHENIDPIAEENESLGTRATALLSIFRSGSRASYGNHSRATVSSAPVQEPAPAPQVRVQDLGTPIAPKPITEEPVQKPTVSAQTTFSVDWDTMRGGNMNGNGGGLTKHASLSLPPPPRTQRRPWTSATSRNSPPQEEAQLNGKAVQSEPSETEGDSSQHDSRTLTPPLSPGLLSSPQASSRRPASVNSTSSYASVEKEHPPEMSRRQSRTVPKMLAPPTGPPPSAPAVRTHSPSFNSPPSPIFEQNKPRRDSGRSEQQPVVYSSPNHPYSKRVSSSSARSVNTVSTSHSFLNTKAHPPPRPPPTFAPPPAPPTDRPDGPSISHHSTPGREPVIPRSLRLSLQPPSAPPTHSLPPRPDEAGYRHRRSHSGEVKSTSTLFPIPGSPPKLHPQHHPQQPPPASPPPSGPLPPTPKLEDDDDITFSRSFQPPSMTNRLRIMSSPPMPHDRLGQVNFQGRDPDRHQSLGSPILLHAEDMFLSMNDTPTTTAHSASFLHVSSPLQMSIDDVESTPLSPPPRRNSRASRELHRLPNLDRDDTKHPIGGSPFDPRDSAVIIARS